MTASLVPLETTVEPLPDWLDDQPEVVQTSSFCAAANARCIEFRHSGWKADRATVLQSLIRTHQTQRRIDAFCQCGANAFLNTDGADLWITASFCRDRLCVPCQVARRSQLIDALLLRMHDVQGRTRLRFCTLTLRATNCTLSDQLDRLLSCFKRLRQREWWKGTVNGGAFFVEVKLGRTGAWHAHLHLLAEGDKYLNQYMLAKEWHAVTGDSFIVDVREVVDPVQRARYVTKYATKPLDSTVLHDPAALDEFVCSIKSRRLFQCFGTWKGLGSDDDEEPARKGRCLGLLAVIHAKALAGDHQSKQLIAHAARKWPTIRDAFPLFGPAQEPATG